MICEQQMANALDVVDWEGRSRLMQLSLTFFSSPQFCQSLSIEIILQQVIQRLVLTYVILLLISFPSSRLTTKHDITLQAFIQI